MFDVAILGLVSLGYSPVIDRNRAVIATRLTVSPLKPDIVLDPSELLAAVGGVWPVDGERVALNVASETLLQDLMRTEPTTNVMVEIPAFMAADPTNTSAIVALHARGNVLMLKGRPLTELPREVLPCFKYAIIDFSDDRRLQEASVPAGISRNIQHVQAGVRSVADMELSFSRGAAAVLGWPIDDVVNSSHNKGKTAGQTDLNTIVELIHRVDTQEPIDKLEATLKRDPTLAFKLMRYINSPAFGLSVEISSFRHAIMMLGYARLKRWLALLLATASKDVNLKPVMFAAVRRGLLMEELVRTGGDEEMRNEMFICGVFSLLDRMFKQPFEDLLKSIPVPEKVYQALVEEAGPYHPFLEVVRAVEDGSPYDFRNSADNLMMSVSEINRAMLRALTAGMQLD
ncbi:MAG: EAL and HDOD domain-containing protein [Burkholderiales bacterium]